MSRLLDNSNQIRNQLQARNLYTPENQYSIDTNATIATLDRLSNVLTPFSGIDLSNTIIARQLEDPVTPLSRIALTMLGKQFAATIKSKTLANTVGKVNIPNLLDGNPNTRFIERDYQITRRERTTAVGRTFGLLDQIFGGSYESNPFDRNSTNADYIRNTSKGQLDQLLYNLNNNIYQPSSRQTASALQSQGYDLPQISSIINRKPNPLGFDNEEFYPFNQYRFRNVVSSNDNLNLARVVQITSLSLNPKQYEYGSTQAYVDTIEPSFDINQVEPNINEGGYDRNGLKEDTSNQIIWGRDGASQEYLNQTVKLRNDEETITNSRFNTTNQFPNNVTGGLLNYTKELLNAQGRVGTFDLTRKKFEDKKGRTMYNGSPLTNNEQDFSRQHNIGDPYNRFAKAIRFNGNKIYENNSNENSVIYDSVMPRIHPTLNDDGVINNRNLFFSLENLAFEVVPNEENGVGIVQNDDFGTEIPLSEVGQNGGRLMWFPPYAIDVNEQTVASHETTNFIGRGEPIYTYSNTERIANINFKLIVDYPPQANGRNHKQAAEFFAFGGDFQRDKQLDIKDKERRKNELIQQRNELLPEIPLASTEIPQEELSFYFPNDEPGEVFTINGGLQNIINADYELNGNTSIDGGGFDLNEEFVSNFENKLKRFTEDDDVRDQVRIRVIGSSSGLYRGAEQQAIDYNTQLTERRIDATIAYIKSKYKQVVNKGELRDNYFVRNNRIVTTDELTDDPAGIPTREQKLKRQTTIVFERNPNALSKMRNISPSDRTTINTLNDEIEALDTQIKTTKATNINGSGIYEKYSVDESYEGGMGAFKKNKYVPAFRSQTPEDFHRRLTFLQQCMRQGAAVRKGDGLSAKNSVFGRQPVSILRLGDQFHTKLIIQNLSIDYTDAPIDLNPEGMGAQYMMADISLQCKIIGGQSLKTPINALQNAISWNYYANSTFYSDGVYKTARDFEDKQFAFNEALRAEREEAGNSSSDRVLNNTTPTE